MTDKADIKKQPAGAKPPAPLKRRGNLVYAVNPFMEGDQRPNIKPKLKRITNRRGDMLVMGETGEIVNPMAGFWQSQEVDSAKFVKLFVNGVKAFRELTNAGARVFEALYMEMQTNIGRDRVYLSASSVAEGIEISESTFARGIRELIDKKFIAPTTQVSWYWLNPDFVWGMATASRLSESTDVQAPRASSQAHSRSCCPSMRVETRPSQGRALRPSMWSRPLAARCLRPF